MPKLTNNGLLRISGDATMSLRRRSIVTILFLAALWIGRGPVTAGDPAEDEARLTKELGGADADRVLAYLRGQLLTPDTKKKIADLIEQMGSPTFRTRQEATKKLIDLGG